MSGKFYYSDGSTSISTSRDLKRILHRENGPAIEWNEGNLEWYWEGQPLTHYEYLLKLQQNKKERTTSKDIDKNCICPDLLNGHHPECSYFTKI